MKRLTLLFALAFAPLAVFAGNTDAGTWKWSLAGQTGDTVLTLKQDGEKLSGIYTNQFGQTQISDGALKDGDITFKVKREFNGQAFVVKYAGKLAGDKITGNCEFDINGQTRSLKWEARREAALAAASGTWNTALILSDGNRIEGSLKLKQEGDKLTGAAIRNENETPIQEGKVVADEITFKVIRDREGRKVTTRYKGKITGDTVKGQVESDWTGDWQTLDWEGARAK